MSDNQRMIVSKVINAILIALGTIASVVFGGGQV